MQWVLKKWLITCPANYVGGGLTQKKEDELRQLISIIAAKVTTRTRRYVRKLGRAAIQEHTGAQLLRTELRDIRKQAIDQEL
jgi:hypothetical protein